MNHLQFVQNHNIFICVIYKMINELSNDEMPHDESSNEEIMAHELSNDEILANEYINKITMELLMSKPNYSKYLESKDPSSYKAQNHYNKDIEKYITVIKSIFDEEVSNTQTQLLGRSRVLKQSFDIFVKECIQYIKMTELNHTNYNDDETMFQNCDEIEEKIKNINANSRAIQKECDEDEGISNMNTNSLWGGSVIKHDMKMLARRKR
jgi:hypothetical protein